MILTVVARLVVVAALIGLAAEPPERLAISFERDESDQAGVRVLLDGEHFTTLRSAGLQKPCLHPLIGPGGVQVTRGFPLDPRPGESSDHPHHTALWFAHGDVDGHDFWHGGHGERIVAAGEPRTEIDDGVGTIHADYEWRNAGGQVVCRERRVMRFSGDAVTRTIDFDLTLTPGGETITFGDTKEGTFALRVAAALRLKGPGAAGSARNSAGQTDGACWGRRAAWVEYSGPIEGRTVGVAIFDHPVNPRHPTWWHARDYGLFAANPFGVHDFEGKPEGTGKLVLEKGSSVRFRYRVVVHEGVWEVADLKRAFEAFSTAAR